MNGTTIELHTVPMNRRNKKGMNNENEDRKKMVIGLGIPCRHVSLNYSIRRTPILQTFQLIKQLIIARQALMWLIRI